MANEVSNLTNGGDHQLREDSEKENDSMMSLAQDQQGNDCDQSQLKIFVAEGESTDIPSSPKKGYLSRSTSSHEQCR